MAWLASPAEGHHWITTAIGLVDERTPTKLVARLMATKATSACQHNDFETQLASSQEAYLVFGTIGDLSGTVWAQERVADALHHFGRFTESDAALREALAGVKVLGEHRLEAQIRQTLAGNRAGLGDITAARVYIAEAVLIYEQCGANGNAAHAISDLGAFEFCEGNVELALSSVTRALAVFRDIGYTIGIADNLVGVATCLVALGRYNEALEFAREALALACENQLTLTSALALEQVGTVAAFSRRPHVNSIVWAIRRPHESSASPRSIRKTEDTSDEASSCRNASAASVRFVRRWGAARSRVSLLKERR